MSTKIALDPSERAKLYSRINKLLALGDPRRNPDPKEASLALARAIELIHKNGLGEREFPQYKEFLKSLRPFDSGDLKSFSAALMNIQESIFLLNLLKKKIELFERWVVSARGVAYRKPLIEELSKISKIYNNLREFLNDIRIPSVYSFDIKKRASFRLVKPTSFINYDLEALIAKTRKLEIQDTFTTAMMKLARAARILNRPQQGDSQAKDTLLHLKYSLQNLWHLERLFSELLLELEKLSRTPFDKQLPFKSSLAFRRN